MPSFTPDDQLELAFPSQFIPESVKSQLPSELHVRRRLFVLVYHQAY